jgi:hypothetical protein
MKRSKLILQAGAAGVFILALVTSGCHSVGNANSPIPPAQIPHVFSNAAWSTALGAMVTPDGYIKWDVVESDDGLRHTLMSYIGLINAVSPRNHAELFPTPADQEAYWINAYNAMCVYAVIKHDYPGTMLAGQPPGAILSTEQFTFGGQPMTLDQVVRLELEPLDDPRVYFAINWCARSCPALRSTPYDGAVLEAQLVDQGQRYLSDPRAAQRDGDAVRLNDLFTAMHRTEFLEGFKKLLGREPSGLIEALQPYVQSDSPIVGATKVENLGFDWSLNRPPR